MGPGEKKAKAEKMEWEQGKLGQVEEGIRAGTGWEKGDTGYRRKSLKQGRTAASRSGALKIYSFLLKEKDHCSCSCAWLGCKHDVQTFWCLLQVTDEVVKQDRSQDRPLF